jgi:hypothetical protein
LAWGWRQEWDALVDLAASAWSAARVRGRRGGRHEPRIDASYPYFDLIRKLGQRLGFVRGTLFPHRR